MVQRPRGDRVPLVGSKIPTGARSNRSRVGASSPSASGMSSTRKTFRKIGPSRCDACRLDGHDLIDRSAKKDRIGGEDSGLAPAGQTESVSSLELAADPSTGRHDVANPTLVDRPAEEGSPLDVIGGIFPRPGGRSDSAGGQDDDRVVSEIGLAQPGSPSSGSSSFRTMSVHCSGSRPSVSGP